jgi:uncharacterized delta-60 repeat protein
MTKASHVIRRWALVLTLLLTLVACGGGESGGGAGSGGAQGTSAVVGPAGGTLLGPHGAKVVIPPGALSADTLIGIEQTSVGAPALPAGFAAFGQMFAFTPHGITFKVPVTITLPFDAAAAPAGSAPALYKTNAQNQWELLSNATLDTDGLSAEVTSFSYGIEKIRAPQRSWSVDAYSRLAFPMTPRLDQGKQNEFVVLKKPYDFGPALLQDPSAPVPDLLPREFRATGRINASQWGDTYSVSGEAPVASDALDPIGNSVSFSQSQTYRKKEVNATLRLKVTQARLEAIDAGTEDLALCTTSRNSPAALCDAKMESWLSFSVNAYAGTPELKGATFFNGYGSAKLEGWRKHWTLAVPTVSAGSSAQNLWLARHFSLDEDVDGDVGHAKLTIAPSVGLVPIDVDLSSIGDEEVFTLDVSATTFVFNPRRSEFTYLGAFFRDPQQIDGDVQVITEGLELLDTPAESPGNGCAPGASPGTLQFISPDTRIGEAVGEAGPMLFVMRTGGSDGEVSATVSTSDGTATAGGDYRSVNTSVTFADGDLAPRAVRVPLIYSADAEPNKTFNVTLSAPTGCASLGLASTAVTILDDTRALPTSFTLGGTVTGLAGSGLVLLSEGLEQSIAGNGPFTFAHPLSNGWLYDVHVKTQPTNPSQVCTVTRGKGTIAANVTDGAVDCTTPEDNGALDASFGAAGKVTASLTGGATAMALQNDGKIVVLGERTLARYNTDGSVDASFGAAGQVPVGGTQNTAQGLALQSDGKIVVVGFTRGGTNEDFAVARYDTSGTLDASFGTGGKVSADFNGLVDRAWAVLIQPNGAIVVAGHAGISSPLGLDNDFAVARFTSGGALDTSFGAGGKVTTNIGGRTDLAHAAALQGDGKIVLAGRVAQGGGDNPDFGLVRYNADGSLDAGFGLAGIVRELTANWDEAADLVIQNDGKIVAAGHAAVGSYGFALRRFNVDGSRDSGFGNNGLVLTTLSTQGDYGRGVALQGDGKIVVVGQTSSLLQSDFAVTRYNADGTLDASFGTGGKLTVDFFGAGDHAQDLAIQADGKIVVSGAATNGTSVGLGLVRINR